MSGVVSRFRVVPAPPFELSLALFGHGWIDLAPNAWVAEAARFETAFSTSAGAAEVRVSESGRGLAIVVLAPTRAAGDEARRAVRRVLRLDEDLRPFWALCAGDPRLAWVAERGAGRLLRSATVFEDLAKLLLTTNCSWAATRGMAARLVAALGAPTPSGARAFPGPERCAAKREGFYREVIRVGYRAPFLCELARGFSGGRWSESDFDDPALSTDELRTRLLSLPGFGPYAAGQALRLLGRYRDLALDSWCRAELAKRHPAGRVPHARTVERRYRSFGDYAGLALWMDLTARWHGQDGERDVGPLAAEP